MAERQPPRQISERSALKAIEEATATIVNATDLIDKVNNKFGVDDNQVLEKRIERLRKFIEQGGSIGGDPVMDFGDAVHDLNAALLKTDRTNLPAEIDLVGLEKTSHSLATSIRQTEKPISADLNDLQVPLGALSASISALKYEEFVEGLTELAHDLANSERPKIRKLSLIADSLKGSLNLSPDDKEAFGKLNELFDRNLSDTAMNMHPHKRDLDILSKRLKDLSKAMRSQDAKLSVLDRELDELAAILGEYIGEDKNSGQLAITSPVTNAHLGILAKLSSQISARIDTVSDKMDRSEDAARAEFKKTSDVTNFQNKCESIVAKIAWLRWYSEDVTRDFANESCQLYGEDSDSFKTTRNELIKLQSKIHSLKKTIDLRLPQAVETGKVPPTLGQHFMVVNLNMHPSQISFGASIARAHCLGWITATQIKENRNELNVNYIDNNGKETNSALVVPNYKRWNNIFAGFASASALFNGVLVATASGTSSQAALTTWAIGGAIIGTISYLSLSKIGKDFFEFSRQITDRSITSANSRESLFVEGCLSTWAATMIGVQVGDRYEKFRFFDSDRMKANRPLEDINILMLKPLTSAIVKKWQTLDPLAIEQNFNATKTNWEEGLSQWHSQKYNLLEGAWYRYMNPLAASQAVSFGLGLWKLLT